MSPTEHPPKTPSPRTGLFASLGARLRAKGIGTPSSRRVVNRVQPPTAAGKPSKPRGNQGGRAFSRVAVSLPTLLIALVCLLAPSAANANFTRKFERPIYRSESSGGHLFTEPCTEAEAGTPDSTCLHPGGVAVNPEGVGPENGLWLGGLELAREEGGVGSNTKQEVLKENELFEFEPASAPGDNAPDSAGSFKAACVEDPGKGNWEESKCLTKATVPGGGDFEKSSAPESVAVESGGLSGNGDLYTAGGHTVEVYESGGVHKHLETWTGFNEPHIAIDNAPELSADPSHCVLGECFVYVSDSLSNTGPSGDLSALQKFNSKDEAVAFTATEPYIAGTKNNEITGRPEGCGEVFKQRGELSGVTVDPEGDIYVAFRQCGTVFEYEPSGKYKQEFFLKAPGVPRVGEATEAPLGVAFDPVSHNLLVTVATSDHPPASGAVDEFEAETGRFVAQITMTPEGELGVPSAVTVDSKGDLYVVESERHAIDVWGPGGYYPTVTLGQATGRTPTSAVLSGSVNPSQEGNPTPAAVTACSFQYVEEAVYDEALAKKEEGFVHAKQETCEPPESHSGLNQSHPVTAKLEHLVAGRTYRYRLVATTEKAANGGTAETESFAFTAPAPPSVESESAENLSSSFADLAARIDPRGADTSYFFEYGPSAAYGHTIPSSSVSIGLGGPTGGSVESVLQHVGGLQPGTTYHFRIVASSECEAIEHPHTQCVTRGEDQTFTTLPAPVSGERGYELVTPANKQGGSDMFTVEARDVGTPSESGEGFLLQTRSSFGEFPFSEDQAYVFRREYAQGRWGYTSLAAPSLGVQQLEGAPLFERSGMATVAFGDGVGETAAEEGRRVTTLIGPPGGPYSRLHEDQAIHGGSEGADTAVVGGSRNLGHVVLDSASHSACPGAEMVKHGDVLCEWSGGYETLEDGETKPTLELVDTAPGSESTPASVCGAHLGALGYSATAGGLARSAVSADGSRVFFVAPSPAAANEKGTEGCWNGSKAEESEGPKNAPQLYGRIGHQEADGEVTHQVVELSTPEAGVKEAGSKEPGERPVAYPVIFMGASEEGSKVFFQTRTWLTENHSSAHDAELYEWEAEGTGVCSESAAGYTPASMGCLTRISAGETGSEAEKEGARTLFVPAVSADGSAVYFTAFSVLAHGATRYATHGQGGGGAVNLYRYDTSSHRTSFVAPVETADFTDQPDCETLISVEQGFSSAWTAPCSNANWYTTPDGRFLLFGDSLRVDGYNVAADGCAEISLPQTQGDSDGRCSEVYRYDALAAEAGQTSVVCVSCGSEGPEGADAAGNAEFDRSPSNGPASSVVQGMSDNGAYVFFDSQAALVPQATNHTLDTYQWHEDLQTHERTVSLIGSGIDPAPTFFLGYSPYEYETPVGKSVCRRDPEREEEPGHNCEVVEGGNVFIGTHAKLSSQQTNSVGNVYDARVCEPESPCIQPPAGETAQCEGGSCQHPPVLPLFQSPATNTLSSSGNIAPPPPPVKPKPLTTAQKLTNALKACKKDKNKKKRATCEASARKKYKTTKAKKSSKSKRGGKS